MGVQPMGSRVLGVHSPTLQGWPLGEVRGFGLLCRSSWGGFNDLSAGFVLILALLSSHSPCTHCCYKKSRPSCGCRVPPAQGAMGIGDPGVDVPLCIKSPLATYRHTDPAHLTSPPYHVAVQLLSQNPAPAAVWRTSSPDAAACMQVEPVAKLGSKHCLP